MASSVKKEGHDMGAMGKVADGAVCQVGKKDAPEQGWPRRETSLMRGTCATTKRSTHPKRDHPHLWGNSIVAHWHVRLLRRLMSLQ